MSKILCISDTHLKPKMFELAEKIMEEYKPDYAIQLGDNIDDFYTVEPDYRIHNAAMVAFKHKYPETIWLYGNHEVHAILGKHVSGNIRCSQKYANMYRENFNPKFAHIDGKVVFSHAGIFNKWSEKFVSEINEMPLEKFLENDSPIWARHNYDSFKVNELYKNKIQIIGHTPEKEIREDIVDDSKIISLDVFSTNWGAKYGEEKMIIIDSLTGKYKKIDIDFRKL